MPPTIGGPNRPSIRLCRRCRSSPLASGLGVDKRIPAGGSLDVGPRNQRAGLHARVRRLSAPALSRPVGAAFVPLPLREPATARATMRPHERRDSGVHRISLSFRLRIADAVSR